MRELYTYQSPGQSSTVLRFLHQLEPKLREKLLWQFFRLSCSQRCELCEPHFKHFTLERYKDLYELRIKNKMLIRGNCRYQDSRTKNKKGAGRSIWVLHLPSSP